MRWNSRELTARFTRILTHVKFIWMKGVGHARAIWPKNIAILQFIFFTLVYFERRILQLINMSYLWPYHAYTSSTNISNSCKITEFFTILAFVLICRRFLKLKWKWPHWCSMLIFKNMLYWIITQNIYKDWDWTEMRPLTF